MLIKTNIFASQIKSYKHLEKEKINQNRFHTYHIIITLKHFKNHVLNTIFIVYPTIFSYYGPDLARVHDDPIVKKK